MEKIIKLFYVLLIFASPITYADEYTIYEGTILTTTGKTVEGPISTNKKNRGISTSFSVDLPNDAGTYQRYTIKTDDVSKFVFIDSDGCNSKYTRKFLMLLKNGNKLKTDKCEEGPFLDVVYIPSRHPVTGELSHTQIKTSLFKEIRFHGPHGQFKTDGNGNIFPADYEYSPFTGESLTLTTGAN